MAWTIGNFYLSEAQMRGNALEVYKYFLKKGWSLNAIAGILGNMQSESNINPGIWQSLQEGNYSGGYGLVQWTPATNYINWAQANGYSITDPIGQLTWINDVTDSVGQWIPTTSYNISFTSFKTSSQSPEWLASAFLKNFERAGVEVEAERRTQARYWYDFLGGQVCPVFAPRMDSAGMSGSVYYYSGNPFHQSGYGLPNCTCYAYGRRYEITRTPPDTSLGNADTWFDYAVAHGQPVGQEPRPGAIMVWKYTGAQSGQGGHVAVVEKVNSDGSVISSNSAWGGAYFYTKTLSPPYEWAAFTSFQGFIYMDCGIQPEPQGVYIDRWIPG